YWAILSGRRQLSMLSHDFGRDQYDDQRDSERNDDEVIKVPDDRDKVRDQVNRRSGVSSDGNSKPFYVPRHAGVACGKIERVGIVLYGARPLVPTFNHFNRARRSLSNCAIFSAIRRASS